MKNLVCLLLLAVICLFCVEATSRTHQRTVQYRAFDDYLLRVVAPKTRAHNQVLKPETTSSSSTPSTTPAEQDGTEDEEEQPDTDEQLLGYFRDVPRQHWSCCMLGILAGKKGFHCHVNFYAVRIAKRNNNRAHSNKMMFHGRDAIENWGRDIMTTFSRCISNEEGEFHRCCRTATVERRELNRWHTNFRHISALSEK